MFSRRQALPYCLTQAARGAPPELPTAVSQDFHTLCRNESSITGLILITRRQHSRMDGTIAQLTLTFATVPHYPVPELRPSPVISASPRAGRSRGVPTLQGTNVRGNFTRTTRKFSSILGYRGRGRCGDSSNRSLAN